MKKGSVKIIAALLVVLLLITGCGTKDTDTNTDGGVVTLQLYQVGDAPKNLAQLQDAINKISEEKIGVKVNFNYIGWGDYEQKMSVMVSGGDDFDIALASNYIVNAQKGAYADLTELVAEHSKEFFDSIDPIYYEGNLINGKLYGFPVNGNVFAQQMLSFNSTFLDKYNIDVSNINSYADAKEALQIIKDNEPGVAPFAIGSGYKATLGNFDYVLNDSLPFAVNMDGDTTKIVNVYETQEAMDTLKQIHELYKAGLIPQDAATSTTSYNLDSDTWFMRQETQGPADYGDALLTQVAGKEIISRPLNKGLKSSAQAQMANFIIPTNSKYKVEAVKWLTLLNTNADMMNTLIYGIEGEAWEKIDDSHLKLLDGYKENHRMAAWNTGNSAILLQPETVTNEMIEQREIDTNNAISSPLLGFSFNTDSVKTEISALQNVMDEYRAVINTGTIDPQTKVKELNDRLASAGIEKVLTEMQTQFDAFLASKN